MDIRTLLVSLRDHKVAFIVIGAWAFPAHGIPRMTADIDIFIKPTMTNAQRTKRALESIGYDVVRDAPADLFLKKKVLVREYVLRTDIHPFVTGVSFSRVWKHKVKAELFGIPVYVPSLNDLIAMKKAAGRPKDLFDLDNLRAVKKKLRKK